MKVTRAILKEMHRRCKSKKAPTVMLYDYDHAHWKIRIDLDDLIKSSWPSIGLSGRMTLVNGRRKDTFCAFTLCYLRKSPDHAEEKAQAEFSKYQRWVSEIWSQDK